MQIHYHLTRRDFVVLSLFLHFRRPLNIVVLLFLPAFFILQLRQAEWQLGALPFMTFLFPLLVLTLIPATVWLAAVRAYDRNDLLRAETVVRLDGAGLHFQIGEATMDYARRDLVRMRRLGSIVLMEFRGRRLHPVPMHALSEGQFNQLRAFSGSL